MNSEVTSPNLPLDPPEIRANGDRRIWIGNLDSRVNEYMLIKLLQKYGKLEKFDFLYHKKGPFTGQPRGYCFATYEKHCEAENAIKSLNGKHALSRKIHAQWASANNLNQFEPKTKVKSDSKPLNSDLQANWSVNQKIVAIEKKLGKMKETENEERNISVHKKKKRSKPY